MYTCCWPLLVERPTTTTNSDERCERRARLHLLLCHQLGREAQQVVRSGRQRAGPNLVAT